MTRFVQNEDALAAYLVLDDFGSLLRNLRESEDDDGRRNKVG